MDTQIIIKQLDMINKDIYQLQKKREGCMKDLAEQCPVKIGDIIRVNGYAYANQHMKVERIKVEMTGFKNDRGYKWTIDGKVLKKDKTPGANWAKSWIKII